MNPDKLKGREVSASSSNRNFKGRQGSPTGRTLLMSPAMVAAAAIEGHVTDVREMLENDLQLEYNNARTLREVIQYCEEVRDYVTRDMLIGILRDTEEDHAYWLKIQLGLMDKLGEEIYLQSMK